MANMFSVIKYILRTAKGTRQEKQNKYIFCVDKKANKVEIKKTIEQLYRVNVVSINTGIMPGKLKRVQYKTGKTADWKKAVVTLKEGEKIETA